MIQNFDSIYWAGMSSWLYAIYIVFFVMFCLCVKGFKFYKVLQKIVPHKIHASLLRNTSLLRYTIKSLLFLFGCIFLMVALLRPQWDKKEELVEQEGRDLLIALDISRSMLAQDEKPNRLEFAKQKIKKILYNLSCERVGLILFSGTTVLQCPLTTDYAAFFMFLDQIDAETISSGTTTLDQAIRQAISVYDNMSSRKTKLLFLFTDGEDFSTNLTGVKEKAAEQKLSIVTFGIGSEHGAPVPVLDAQGKQTGFEKDLDGSIIMSKLNEGILKNLSKQTGGKYFHASSSDTDVQQVIQYVQKFEKDKLEDKTVDQLQEKYHYFVAGAFVCLALEWLL
ncbi:MAG: hypothetical protein CL947_00240 [Epsilonproteobacteria bacterium]|nr:hypothetical protein [Campylobacterota bacterium]|tara:strand:- start:6657 stop:7667 length:1011 start_codon:yes stop_codon:yes gene_type:complete